VCCARRGSAAAVYVGLHYCLRLRDGYQPSLCFIYTIAVMLPVLALLGFWGAGIDTCGRKPPAGGRCRRGERRMR
jgi:hypothetical protein